MPVTSQNAFKGLLPKTSTQALEFIKQNPEYDGRGVVIGIFDTGVDPGAAGLQVCPDGSQKILDIHDCTGAGDVEMKEIRTTQLDLDTGKEFIYGLTGRKLLLNSEWSNPTKEYRVGMKAVYDIFPEPLVNRIKIDRKLSWEREQNAAEVLAARTTSEDSKLKKELEERLTQLKAARDSYTDLGPVVDVVSFLDDEGMWRVVIDCDQSGELYRVEKPLTVFRAESRYGTWDSKSQMNYGINIYQNGEIVSIVVDSGSHGTHVAGIAAAFYGEDKPEVNGVAPGAQIISFKIGDTRIGGMETGTAIIRALTAAAAAGVDVINMSFGEPSHSCGSGRVVELCRQLVLKHHITFVASAGNSGPALSTVGAPGGSTPHLIGVGAYVEPEMMTAEYFMRTGELPPATHYTWSSRGPSFDGQLGVSISAPGGAIASVPTWTLSGKQLMNGTSMAAPSATGCIALMLSAMKAQGIPRSPARVRRAVESSASVIPNVEYFAQGHGLIQVNAAFECAKQGADVDYLDLPFEVKIPSRNAFTVSQSAHGIYLREPAETNSAQEHTVEITTLFATDEDDPDVGFSVERRATKKQQINTEVRVQLEVSNGGNTFVRVPDVVFLTSKAASFKIFVDPAVLPKGSATFCEVVGYDATIGKVAGALFRVPITVIRPELPLDSQSPDTLLARSVTSSPLLYDPVARFPGIKLEPSVLLRKFFQVPAGATWCDLRVVNESFNPEDRLFVLHCLQVRPQSRFRDDELEIFARLGGDVGASINRSMKVVGGSTLEVCIAPYWSSLGSFQVTLEVYFNGVDASPGSLSLGPHTGFLAQTTLRASIKDLRVEPSGELTKWLTTVGPSKSKTILEARYPESRNAILAAFPPDARPTWELRLWFELAFTEKCKPFLRLPLRMNDFLYDSPFDSQMMFVFDSKRRVVSVTDYGHTQKAFEAEKGQYEVLCIIRHEKRAPLERLRDLALIIERPLPSNIALSSHSAAVGPSAQMFKFEPKILKRGFETVVFFAPPSPDDLFKRLPSGCKPGDVLLGSVQFIKRNKDQVGYGSDDKPGGYSVHLVLPSKSPAASSSQPASGINDSSKGKFANAKEEHWMVPLLRSKLKLLESLPTEVMFNEEANVVHAEITALLSPSVKNEMFLSLAMLRLRRRVKDLRDALKTFEEGEHDNDDLVQDALLRLSAYAEDARAEIDVEALERKKLSTKVSVVNGELQDKDTQGDDEKARTDMLVEILLARIHGILDVDAVLNPSTPPSAELSGLIEEVARWISDKSAAFVQIKLRLAMRASRWATSLPLIERLMQEDDADLQRLPSPLSKSDLNERRIQLYEELGWTHLAKAQREYHFIAFPANYPVF